MPTPYLALAGLLVGTALAQSTIVSPAGNDFAEGSGSNTIPFGSSIARRYLQIHDDIGGSPKLITRLSFRPTTHANVGLVGTRIYDIELYMGEGIPGATPNFVFDANYNGGAAGRILVMPRTTVTWGPQANGNFPNPSAFGTMDLVLTTPFQYSGTAPLVWEVVYHGQTTGTAGTFVPADADASSTTLVSPAVTGLGCVASAQAAAMTHGVSGGDFAGRLALNFTVANGPGNTFCLLGIGFANPNLAISGLCSPLYTDLASVSAMGFTNGVGALTAETPLASSLVASNILQGVTLYSQVHAIDTSRPLGEYEFSNSDGRSWLVPTSTLTRQNQVARIYNASGGTTATMGAFTNTVFGYALVTQFTY